MIKNKQKLLFNSRYKISENGCWNWTWNKDKDGYGQFHARPNHQRAHRFSYEMFYGEFDYNLLVCHKCDNTSCVNPEHLFLGTVSDNHKDKLNKNRHRKQYRNNKCKNGHEFTEKNTLKNRTRKHRTCYVCFKIKSKIFKKKYRLIKKIKVKYINAISM